MKILSKVTVAVAALALVLGTASAASALTYTGTLKVGSRGAAVSSLQTCLNGKGMSAGVADGIFGMGTKAAVMRFQSANSLTVDGVAGMATHAALGNCSTTVVNNDNNDNGEVDLNDFIIDGGEEVDLQDFDAKDGDDDSVVEGATSKEIAYFEFTPEDSDFLLERIHFVFAGDDNNDETINADEAFEDITLFINGDEVDTIDASDSDNWDDDKYGDRDTYSYLQDTTENVMSLPFKSINEILSEGDEVTITLEADISSSVDGSNDGEQWDIYIPADGLRGIDTSGSTSYLGDITDFASVTIEGEGADNAFDISEGEDNPDDTTVEVDDTDRTTFTAFEFDIEAADNGENLQINDIAIEADTLVENYVDIVYNTVLEIDGEEYDVDVVDVAGASQCDGSGAYTGTIGDMNPCLVWSFDRNQVVVEAGDTVTAKLMVEVKKLDGINYNSGEVISFATQADDYDVEGDDSKENVTDLNGAVSGNDQSLVVDGINVEFVSASSDKTTPGFTGADEYVEFTLVFDVTAFGRDIYVDETCGFDGTPAYADTQTSISSDNDVNPTCGSGELTSNADHQTNSFRVAEGTTKRFTATVVSTADEGALNTATTYVARINAIGYAFTDVDGTEQYNLDMDDYKSSPVTAVNR